MVGFIVTAAVGFILLLTFLIFDGIFDAIDIDIMGSGVFSGASLGGLITGFGCGGVIGTSLQWPLILSIALGLVVGVAIAAVAVALYRLLKNAESAPEDFSLDKLVGSTGVVTAGSKAGERGLVQLMYLGSPRTVSFSSDTPIATGESVLVTEINGVDSVNVISTQSAGRTLE
ncbi:MAG: hypothetical protein LBE83_08155 [Propionibacteriaceae bacterium]|jgi:hypothetical protein|nr:hypothetical protein [Propionibacteriaceae bacterium]